MLPAAAVAARLLLPVSVSVVYVIYKYWRSGRQTESWVPPNRGNNDDVTPNSGNNGVVPPNSVVRPKSCKNDVVPSDGDLAVVEEILKNDHLFFHKIRTLDPAVLDELLKIDPGALDQLLRIDPAVLRDSAELDPAIIDAISELSEKEEGDEEADWSCSRPVTESSLVIGVPTNSGNNDVVPSNSGNNDDVTPNSGNNGVVPPNSVVRPKSCKNDVVPSDGDLAVVEEILKNDHVFFDKIRTLDPAVLDELLKIDSVALDELLKIDPVALDELLRIDPAALRDSAELDPAIIDAICELSEKEEGDEEADWGCSRPVTESSLVIGVPTNSGNNDVVPSNSGDNDVVPSNSGNNDVVPPNSGNNDVVPCPELSDRDLAILEEILKDDPVLLYEIRTHDPAVINELRKFDPAVLREMVLDSAEVDPTIIDAIRKLCLKRKEEDEKEAKGSCSGRETESENENGNETQRQERDEEISRSRHYPLRPEAADCSYYLKTGTCKFRSNCKFNHPRTTTKNNQDHFWSGGRKDGRDGSFNPRSREPFAAPFVENFMGLPIRPGERDCTYYMRNLSCRYGLSCRFNHPDPTPAGESDPPSGYGNGGPASLQGASSSTAARWSAPKSQGIPSRNTEHNGYQATETSMPAPPPYVFNHSVTKTNAYEQYLQQQQVEELPQRPGQPVCIYFSTTGDCEFKSNCKYHHPKNQTAVSPSCALNDKGLPLRPQQQVEELPQRPGQPVCIYFSTTGDCEFKSNCKYHHPKNQTAVSPSCALNDKGLPLRPQQQVEELPQRPGQPVCIYFSTTGDCEFKSNCKYHHPKNQTAVSPSCALNDKGLPLRPGQNICTQYSTYGICNSGPACKFDHPSL